MQDANFLRVTFTWIIHETSEIQCLFMHVFLTDSCMNISKMHSMDIFLAAASITAVDFTITASGPIQPVRVTTTMHRHQSLTHSHHPNPPGCFSLPLLWLLTSTVPTHAPGWVSPHHNLNYRLISFLCLLLPYSSFRVLQPEPLQVLPSGVTIIFSNPRRQVLRGW